MFLNVICHRTCIAEHRLFKKRNGALFWGRTCDTMGGDLFRQIIRPKPSSTQYPPTLSFACTGGGGASKGGAYCDTGDSSVAIVDVPKGTASPPRARGQSLTPWSPFRSGGMCLCTVCVMSYYVQHFINHSIIIITRFLAACLQVLYIFLEI